MPNAQGNGETPRLEVYLNRSELYDDQGRQQTFVEGKPSAAAKARHRKIRQTLEAGFLDQVIAECRDSSRPMDELADRHEQVLTNLVNSVTSEVGRALVVLTVLQLAVKAIEPAQSIRLHKSGPGDFSWAEGLPMRGLDADFVSTFLRNNDLMRLNKFGAFMTRSLAENYPYSKLYKAALRGARAEWLQITDWIEFKEFDPRLVLKHLLAMLINRSETFANLAEAAIKAVQGILPSIRTIEIAEKFLLGFVAQSSYAARLFEVAMHSLFQALEDARALDGFLVPLSQMRSANKKHGNIGDIELATTRGGKIITEAWDAKFGKVDLRDELEELNDKLEHHPHAELVGFVTNQPPVLGGDMVNRVAAVADLHGVRIEVFSIREWVDFVVRRSGADPAALAPQWVQAFVGSLCQKRRERAPIDEPADGWLMELLLYVAKWH